MSLQVKMSKEYQECMHVSNRQPGASTLAKEAYIQYLMFAAGCIGYKTCTGRQAFYVNLYSFQANLESVRLLAYSGGHSDSPGSTVTEALQFGAAPLHDVIRQICNASRELGVPADESCSGVCPFSFASSGVRLLSFGSSVDLDGCVQ